MTKERSSRAKKTDLQRRVINDIFKKNLFNTINADFAQKFI